MKHTERRNRNIALIALVVIAVLTAGYFWYAQEPASAAWYDSGYSYCRKFTLNSSEAATTTSSGFALMASSTIADLKHTDHGGNIQQLQDDDANTPNKVPKDVVFTDGTDCVNDGGSKIDFYFEEYASTTGAFTAWVEHPDVSSTTDKAMLMYYGSNTATDQSNESGVWGASGEEAVYNFHEDPSKAGASGVLDSTANNNDGTDNGSMTASDLIDGQVDGALDFDGSDDHINVGAMSNIVSRITDPRSVSFWIKTSVADNTLQAVLGSIDRAQTNDPFWLVHIERGSTQGLEFYIRDTKGDYQRVSADVTLNDGVWHHALITYAGTAASVRMFVDGAEFSTYVPNDQDLNNDVLDTDLYVGARNDNDAATKPLDGSLDDVRMYSRALSPADIITIYNNTSNNADFWTIGTEEINERASTKTRLTIDSGRMKVKGGSRVKIR